MTTTPALTALIFRMSATQTQYNSPAGQVFVALLRMKLQFYHHIRPYNPYGVYSPGTTDQSLNLFAGNTEIMSQSLQDLIEFMYTH